ncbi:septum site-determining protein MinC [Psychromonas sp. CD1]|uniref:septum site-determining protein MinC n=1 Tax=Psychromonas sp. CD1 TaxID=1979839 RepID=UPI000B9AA801|nr:septum site-determining protein MinC [Psychromonas sp. CD1]
MALKSLNFALLVVNVKCADLIDLANELNKKRIMAPEFFSYAPVVVALDNNSLEIDFLELKKVVSAQQFILIGISGELSETQKRQAQEQGVAILRNTIHSLKKKERTQRDEVKNTKLSMYTDESEPFNGEVKTIIHHGRVRSGQQIYAKECDLVINGDVGAGAEVIADGNIHIYGALRGKALAGAMGEKTVSIFCQIFTPELVSIAGVYKLSDALPIEFSGKSCVVSMQDEQLVLASLNKVN